MLNITTGHHELVHIKMMIGLVILFFLCFVCLSFLMIKKFQHDKIVQRKTIDALNNEIAFLKTRAFNTLSVPSPFPKNGVRLSAI